MNCKIDARKTTQVVARLIQKSGEPLDYLRMIKLVYLAERESLLKRGIPIVGGQYFSMNKGPAISELMDFVQTRNAPGWKELISPRMGNDLKLKASPTFESLSAREVEILDSTMAAHATKTTEELVEWCHKNCSETEEVPLGGRNDISIESILSAGKIPADQIAKVVSELESMENLDALLS